MPFANIQISKGSQILHGWYIHPIPYEMSVKDIFIKLITKEISSECNVAVTSSDKIERVEISEMPATVATQVNLNCGIIELTTSVEIRVYYLLKSDDTISITLVPQWNSLIGPQKIHMGTCTVKAWKRPKIFFQDFVIIMYQTT
jgi:hypothetical protein